MKTIDRETKNLLLLEGLFGTLGVFFLLLFLGRISQIRFEPDPRDISGYLALLIMGIIGIVFRYDFRKKLNSRLVEDELILEWMYKLSNVRSLMEIKILFYFVGTIASLVFVLMFCFGSSFPLISYTLLLTFFTVGQIVNCGIALALY